MNKKKIIIVAIVLFILVLFFVIGNLEMIYIHNGGNDSRGDISPALYKVNYSIRNNGAVYNESNEKIGNISLGQLIPLKINVMKLKWYIFVYGISGKDELFVSEYIELNGKQYTTNMFSLYNETKELYEEIVEQASQYSKYK